MKNNIAVLLATYNGEKYLTELLESLVSQSKANFDLIVADDGSTDSTLMLIEKYKYRLNIKFFQNDENLGPALNFLNLLRSAPRYKTYMFCDQDDVWNFDKIERAIAMLEHVPSSTPGLYCAKYEAVTSNLEHIAYSKYPTIISFENSLVENVVTGCTVAINSAGRELLLEVTPNSILMHDWWMYICFSSLGSIVYDNNVVLKYRQHESNAVGISKSKFQNWLRRVKSFYSRVFEPGKKFSVFDQLNEFRRAYGVKLPIDYCGVLDSFIKSKYSFRIRLNLFFSKHIVRQNYIDCLIVRFMLLFNKY